jgi:hypothetical protein
VLDLAGIDLDIAGRIVCERLDVPSFLAVADNRAGPGRRLTRPDAERLGLGETTR